jgi:hypothetical protein
MSFGLAWKKRALLGTTFLIVFGVIVLKFAVHWMGWEFLSLNPLLSGIVAANVFLMGFLLSGVLADYKESERLPGELTVALEALADDAICLHHRTQAPIAREFHGFVAGMGASVQAWLYRRERTTVLMERVAELNRFVLAFEPLMAANYIVRIRQEQSALRRMVIRIHTIRETSFVSSGYLIAESVTALLALGLILVKIDPFYESVFFVGVITFFLTFLNLLIRDLDNPFGYVDVSSAEDVSLKPLEDLVIRLKAQGARLGWDLPANPR